jgi:dipeptidyl aminopeptidase/acylaminoacyl peptidase
MIMRTRTGVSAAVAAVATLLLAAGAALVGAGQSASEPPVSRYLTPPRVIVDLLDAPPLPQVVVSPTRDVVALLERRSMPPIAELAQPMLPLAGHRINPRTNGPHRTPGVTGLVFKPIGDGAERRAALPTAAILLPLGFSADGGRFAAAVVRETRVELWIADVATGRARAVSGLALNAAWDASPCEWLVREPVLFCRAVPNRRGSAPERPAIPTGPIVQETAGAAAPRPTFQDLLADEHDERLFEYYFTSQLAFVDPERDTVTPVGQPGLYELASPSPDGAYLLVARVKRPFSRLVPAEEFPKDVEIWTREGRLVRRLADLPSGENVPINGVLPGPRAHRWHSAAPATVVWAEPLDAGDPRREVPHRDRLLALEAPFRGEPRELVRTAFRFQNVAWTDRGVALVTEFDRQTRRTRTWLADEGAAPRMLWDRNVNDRYRDPGQVVFRPRPARTILQDRDSIYLVGDGASPEGDRPFLDRLDLTNFATERLFRTDTQSYEPVIAVLTDDGRRLLTRRETRTDPPNYVVRDVASGTSFPLTRYPDPAPALRGVDKRLLTYKRRDGVTLSATLYLPPGYRPGERLPLLMWAYPREFGDPDTAGQVSGSANRFTTVTGPSHLALLTQGYAVLDDPRMPIIGPGETANDTYVEQLVASAEAAVETVVALGVAARDRLGIGGHSYGAFMTANLLAHSDLFRAGIARSGAYNRTLTPFGFQNERRTFWEVPEVYARMSPFFHAHKIDEPILLIHGMADDNSGTFPIQSERLYLALKGLGKTARYVQLPYEAHGYLARESVLHTVAEMLAWMDRWVKHAPPRSTSAGAASRF